MALRGASPGSPVWWAVVAFAELAWATRQRGGTQLGQFGLPSLPQHLQTTDCQLARPISQLSHGSFQPVVGRSGASATSSKLIKDGFYHVECVRDYMYEFGDRVGPNRADYALAASSNASIVHYSAAAPSTLGQPRQLMTPNVCFAFCRQIPTMHFFGLRNGYECYCTPFYKPIQNNTPSCDMVCEGDTESTCGGTTVSSIFAMHECTQAAKKLAQSSQRMEVVTETVSRLVGRLRGLATRMNSSASALLLKFKLVKDLDATIQLQSAKASGVHLLGEAEAAAAVPVESAALLAEGAGLAMDDFRLPGPAALVANLTQRILNATAASQDESLQLQKLLDGVVPNQLSTKASTLYAPVMHFIDTRAATLPATCGGSPLGLPLFANLDACAAACETSRGRCIAFGHFRESGGELCFLFAQLASVTYYEGCRGKPASFPWRPHAAHSVVQCMAQTRRFRGVGVPVARVIAAPQCFE